jgi:hypothetical protein
MQTPPPVQTMQTPTGAVRSRSDCSQQIKGHFTIQRPPAHHRCLVIMRKPPCRHHRSIGNGVDSLRIVSCVRLVRSIAASPALALELRRRPRCSRRPLDHRALPALRSPPCWCSSRPFVPTVSPSAVGRLEVATASPPTRRPPGRRCPPWGRRRPFAPARVAERRR